MNLAATLLFVVLWASCGGDGAVPPPGGDTPRTPAGTFPLTLTVN